MIFRIYDANQRNNLTSGYGLMAKQIADNLKHLGHQVKFFPDDGTSQDIVIFIRPPHYIKYPEFKDENINIFFTMHEKETFEGWKSDWPELLNKCDLIVVPTEWNKGVFENHGVTKPIEVVPLGVNPKDYHGAKTYEFSILTLHSDLGSDQSRENWKDTLKAYFNAFYGFHEKEVVLNIKSYNIKQKEYLGYWQSLAKDKDITKVPPINVINVTLEPRTLNDLYGKHHLFIKNANREGWSLPLWEAMSSGVKVLHSNLPVFSDVDERFATSFPLGDIETLTTHILTEFDEWRKRKSFINNYTWRKCTERLLNAIEKTRDRWGE